MCKIANSQRYNKFCCHVGSKAEKNTTTEHTVYLVQVLLSLSFHFYFMDYLALGMIAWRLIHKRHENKWFKFFFFFFRYIQHQVFEINTCEISIDYTEIDLFPFLFRAVVTWAISTVIAWLRIFKLGMLILSISCWFHQL